jgi:hypothetical protein
MVDEFERAGSGLGQHARFLRAVALGGDSAPAPKATAERMIAPTLCGSVT